MFVRFGESDAIESHRDDDANLRWWQELHLRRADSARSESYAQRSSHIAAPSPADLEESCEPEMIYKLEKKTLARRRPAAIANQQRQFSLFLRHRFARLLRRPRKLPKWVVEQELSWISEVPPRDRGAALHRHYTRECSDTRGTTQERSVKIHHTCSALQPYRDVFGRENSSMNSCTLA